MKSGCPKGTHVTLAGVNSANWLVTIHGSCTHPAYPPGLQHQIISLTATASTDAASLVLPTAAECAAAAAARTALHVVAAPAAVHCQA